jgi:eukaryotic-like serine/threonine-protein kinase
MRRGLFIGGVALLVVGLLLVVVSFALQAMPTTEQIPAGSAAEITPTGVGGASLAVSWSGGDATTQTYLVSGTPACGSPSNVVAHGSGASGSFSASITSGTTYYLYACHSLAGVSTYETAQFSYSATGISILVLVGIVLAVIGAVLSVLGFRGQPKMRPAEESVEEAGGAESEPASAYAVPAPMMPESPPASQSAPIGSRAEPAPPPRFMPASPSTGAPAATAPGTKARPSLTCSYCGAVNEAWITNCRKCKRPLSSTGSA